MGFGGAVQAMITTLKNNEKMRSKRSKFKTSVGSYRRKQKPEYDFPEATPELLETIKEKLQKEQRRRMVIVWVLTVLIFLGLVYVIIL